MQNKGKFRANLNRSDAPEAMALRISLALAKESLPGLLSIIQDFGLEIKPGLAALLEQRLQHVAMKALRARGV